MDLPIKPEEATKILLKKLPSRRMRDVLEKRFGLRGGRRKTLETIGAEYRITRERVRQIEADALKYLNRKELHQEIEPLFAAVAEHLNLYGKVMSEHHLFATLTNGKPNSHLVFLLNIGVPFANLAEDNEYYERWTIDKSAAALAEKAVKNAVEDLKKIGHPVSGEELNSLITQSANQVLNKEVSAEVTEACLKTSKLLQENPYGEYGLSFWPTINPRGVKDKAFLVLLKSGKPLHFREVAAAINKAGWPARLPAQAGAGGSKKRAHPQTVHNELIKDNRFVLVGRGLYALREWGYEPGTVKDVLVSVVKASGHPMSRDEIVQAVLDKRMVKTPTVFLNLQNKSLFKRTEDGKYTLV